MLYVATSVCYMWQHRSAEGHVCVLAEPQRGMSASSQSCAQYFGVMPYIPSCTARGSLNAIPFTGEALREGRLAKTCLKKAQSKAKTQFASLTLTLTHARRPSRARVVASVRRLRRWCARPAAPYRSLPPCSPRPALPWTSRQPECLFEYIRTRIYQDSIIVDP